MQLDFFPPTQKWTPPTTLPSLRSAPAIALDLETKDPHLKTRGPGWTTGSGHIVGISIATGDQCWYFPIRHFGGGNLNPKKVLGWLRQLFIDYKGELILANAQYDLGWLHREDIHPKCRCIDVQLIEPLLDEEARSYSLDSLAKRYLGYGKDEELLRHAAKVHSVDPKSGMWKLHSSYVGPYAEWDARATYDIYLKQKPRIISEDIEGILALEEKTQPILLAMAERGVRVDVPAAERLWAEWGELEGKLLSKHGIHKGEIWTTDYLKTLFRRKKIEPLRTPPTKGHPSGQPSFPKEFLRTHPDPDVVSFANLREISRLREVYIWKRIMQTHIDGRVYPHYNQLAGDEGGTKTGRLACRYHNKQQIPKRSDLVDAKRIRSLYLPEDGEHWLGADYDSQEPRLQVHYGLRLGFKGAKETAAYIAKGKKLYHAIQDFSGCTYNQAKTVYLGLSYGMGVSKLASELGVTEEVARDNILVPLEKRCPFMKQFAEAASARAAKTGYVKTILGRKKRFNMWQSTNHWNYVRDFEQRQRDGCIDKLYWWLKKASTPFHSREEAEEFFKKGNDQFQRAFTNKAGNAVIQGSAADQTKAALCAVYEHTGKFPLSQVHDELNYSIASENEVPVIKEIMETVVELALPTKADCEVGSHW